MELSRTVRQLKNKDPLQTKTKRSSIYYCKQSNVEEAQWIILLFFLNLIFSNYDDTILYLLYKQRNKWLKGFTAYSIKSCRTVFSIKIMKCKTI